MTEIPGWLSTEIRKGSKRMLTFHIKSRNLFIIFYLYLVCNYMSIMTASQIYGNDSLIM